MKFLTKITMLSALCLNSLQGSQSTTSVQNLNTNTSQDVEELGIHDLLTNFLASKDLDMVTPSTTPISLSVNDIVRFKSKEVIGAQGSASYSDTQYSAGYQYQNGAATFSNNIYLLQNSGTVAYSFLQMTKPGTVMLTIQTSKHDPVTGGYTINPNATRTYILQIK